MLIPKNTKEAFELGKKLSIKEVLAYWKEYNRSLSESNLSDLLAGRDLLKKAFREQMLRETVEGYLGNISHHSLTKEDIEMLLEKRRRYGTVPGSTDRKSL